MQNYHRASFIVLLMCIQMILNAQTVDSSDLPMAEVIIKTYEQDRQLRNTSAAVNYLGPSELRRVSPNSIVYAVNASPGVKMEERSPGSYRFSIRGSSLRSPFGVRNVKVYYNGIPITDPGGHTYLNQLGYYNFRSMEILKGPGSSLYGAGTGGVVLISSLDENEDLSVKAEYMQGSFSNQNIYLSLVTGNKKYISKIGLQRQRSKGYRNHSELEKDVHSWQGIFHIDEKRILKTSFLYGDLFYETPGALTRMEYEADPRASRPATGSFPGAEQSRASVQQRAFISGASLRQQLNGCWNNTSVLYGMFTELTNPTIRNYSRSAEPHVGGRTVFNYINSPFRFDIGVEWQEGFATVNVHKNTAGLPDSLLDHDEINDRNQLIFLQGSVLLKNWTFMAGASSNYNRMKYERFEPAALGPQIRKLKNLFLPRISIAKHWKNLSLYTSVSKGFSPPSTVEFIPTGGNINNELEAEEGINYDVGIRTSLNNGLYVDVNAFYFTLENMIVQRRDAAGGDYFVNAGKTRQYGIESLLNYTIYSDPGFFRRTSFWISHTWHQFEYRNFKQLNNDYSGNKIPGVAPQVMVAGADLHLVKGISAFITYHYNQKYALNDANSDYSSTDHIVNANFQYGKSFLKTWMMRIALGVENLLDQQYNLGYDINGFGGRYFNSAPGRNYFATITIQRFH